jgi:choline kinase
MKGLILAAGDGGRLRPLTLEMPKVLLELGGRPLIHQSIDALRSAGISQIAVAVGYQSEKILNALDETLPPLTFVYNQHYYEGNALSVYAARAFLSDGPFVVCMGDHLISPGIVQSLLSEQGDGCVLCVDSAAWHSSQTNDATRVQTDLDGYITNIGKHLKDWNTTDTGVFKMTGEVFPAIEHLMDGQGMNVSITDVVTFMGEIGQTFATCDVSGMLWADVDTVEDYEAVDSLLKENYGERV